MNDFEAELLRKHQCRCPQVVTAGTLSPAGGSRNTPWQGKPEPWRVWEVGQSGRGGAGTKGEDAGFPKQVPLLRVLFIRSRGHLLSLPQPGGRRQGREGSILLSMASPERM